MDPTPPEIPSTPKVDEDAVSLCEAAARHFDLDLTPSAWLAGGDEALVLKATGGGSVFVLHASPDRLSREELLWAHSVAQHAARSVPQAISPIERHGTTLCRWRNRSVALYPFVDGDLVKRTDPLQQLAAARALAKVHVALLDWNGGPRPNADANRGEAISSQVMSDTGLDSWWERTRGASLHSVIHGDFYQRNLIARGSEIVGIIDWHDCTIAPLALELAGAAFEFSRDENHGLDVGRARGFTAAYRAAGGPVPTHDLASLGQFMRMWLRRDVALNLLCGTDLSDPYIARQIAAFRNLADLDL